MKPVFFVSLFLWLAFLPVVGLGAKGIELHIDTGAFADGIFPHGKSAELGVSLENRMKVEAKLKIDWQLKTDEKQTVASHSEEKILKAGEKTKVTFVHELEKPGFYWITVNCSWDGGKASRSMQVGYAPEKLRPPLTAQPDLRAFWDEALAKLAKVPPCFKMIPRSAKGNAHIDVYEVQMRSLGDVRVRGWYEVPKKPGPHPVLMRVPGYGQNMRPIGRFKDMIVFSFNVRGHGNSQEDIKGKPGNYWIRGLDDKEGYYYQGAYMDCVRAVDFLCSRKEVDAKRIAVGGSSQGGGLSFATAALDQRVSLCVPDVPFLANWEKYFKTTHWPEMNKWIDAKESRTWKSTLETLSYFDAMNLAPWIKCPVFMGVGLQDGICPPATNFAPFNYAKGSKEVRVYPQAKHGVGSVHHRLAFEWIRKEFGLEKSH
ncbi:MAG: acetylxylan esterase [Opitutales bacterium]